jgi:uncharacterized SAM-binding protein YcdF (DUF218 family)
MTAMAERDGHSRSDDERARDAELLAAINEHEPIGERYARTGEVPVTVPREPSMAPSPGAEVPRDPTPVKPIPRPPRALGRMVVRGLIAVGALVVLYFLVSLWQVWSTGRSDQTRGVDAIVVMGAAQYDGEPSPQLGARLDHAVELWNDQVAEMIVVTGGNRPGDRFTEAESSARYLVDHDVPASAIVQENEGSTTYESMDAVFDLVGGSVRSVLIVTDPYHALRSRLIAQEVGFVAYVSPADESVVTGTAEIRRELGEAAGVAVGRVIGFERLSALTD